MGAFQNAMIASPIYLSMVAPFCISTSVIGVRKLLRKTVSSVASMIFGQPRKAAYVAKEKREIAVLATKFEALRILHQPLYHGRR